MVKRRIIDCNDRPLFVTTNTRDRSPIFSNAAFAQEAIDQIYRTQQLHPFLLFGFVIMPDHCHFLLNVLEPVTISQIMNTYKSGLAHQIGQGTLWQPRYDLRIPQNGWKVLDYIDQNPVKAGLCATAKDYPWSSASGKYDVTRLDDSLKA